TPLPAGPRSTIARTNAPCVTSGSSPASLTTPALARPPASARSARVKLGRCPRGSAIVTGSGNAPVASATNAAFAAAVAQAPVVQPWRSGRSGGASSLMRARLAPRGVAPSIDAVPICAEGRPYRRELAQRIQHAVAPACAMALGMEAQVHDAAHALR